MRNLFSAGEPARLTRAVARARNLERRYIASSGGAGLANCVMISDADQTIAANTESQVTFDNSTFATTDDAVLSVSGNTIEILQTGLYLGWLHVDTSGFTNPQKHAVALRWANHGSSWPLLSPQRLIDTDSGGTMIYPAGDSPISTYYYENISFAYISDVTSPGATCKAWFNNEDSSASVLAACVFTVWQIAAIDAAVLAGFPAFQF